MSVFRVSQIVNRLSSSMRLSVVAWATSKSVVFRMMDMGSVKRSSATSVT